MQRKIIFIKNRMRLLLLCALCFSISGFGQEVKLVKYYKGDSLYVDLANYRMGPVWLEAKEKDSVDYEVRFMEYGKVKSQDTLNAIIVLPKIEVPDTTGFKIYDYLDISFKTADPRAVHQEDYPYYIPYSAKSKYKIVQSFGGKFSHSLPTSRYAIDFDMPIGTPIMAVRKV